MVHRVWVREIQLLEDAKPCKFPDEKITANTAHLL